jgi:hypothetical protein
MTTPRNGTPQPDIMQFQFSKFNFHFFLHIEHTMQKRKRLTPKERDEVLAILSAGCSRSAAARCVRCSLHMLKREIQKNPQFAEQVAKAEEGIELFYVSRIRSAAQEKQYWRAAAWALERRLPNRYGGKKQGILTTDQVQRFMAKCIQILVDELPSHQQRETIFNRLSEELEEI